MTVRRLFQLLLGRIETVRQWLLASPALPADAEAKVFAALTALGAFERVLSAIEDLETLAAAAPAPVRDLPPEPSGQ